MEREDRSFHSLHNPNLLVQLMWVICREVDRVGSTVSVGSSCDTDCYVPVVGGVENLRGGGGEGDSRFTLPRVEILSVSTRLKILFKRLRKDSVAYTCLLHTEVCACVHHLYARN